MTILRHDNIQRTIHLLVQSMVLHTRVVVTGKDASVHRDGTMVVTGIVNSVALKSNGKALVSINRVDLVVDADNLTSVKWSDARVQTDTSRLAGWGDWLWGRG